MKMAKKEKARSKGSSLQWFGSSNTGVSSRLRNPRRYQKEGKDPQVHSSNSKQITWQPIRLTRVLNMVNWVSLCTLCSWFFTKVTFWSSLDLRRMRKAISTVVSSSRLVASYVSSRGSSWFGYTVFHSWFSMVVTARSMRDMCHTP